MNAILDDVDLTGAALEETDLTNAKLKRADFTNADLRGADLTGADLSDANLSQALLTYSILDGILQSERTLWPADFDWSRPERDRKSRKSTRKR